MAAPDTGGLPGLSVRRPFLAAVMNLMIVVAGVAALMGIEVRELPDVDRPVVSVRGDFPGAAPTTVDAEVTSVVEGAVSRVAGVISLTASSEEGNFRMRAEFAPGTDLALAASDVREAVSRVTRRLPAGVRNLYVVKADQDASPIMRIVVSSTVEPIGALTQRVQTEIVPNLISVDGVADVTLFGDRERVLRVEVHPARLAALGLSVAEVADALEDAQFDVPVGSFEAGEQEVLVRADASVVDPSRIERLMIRDPVRLGQVADVYFGLSTPDSVARVDGRMVVSMGIIRQATANTVQIAADIHREVERMRAQYPQLTFQTVSDDSVFVRGAIEDVLKTLAVALMVVVVVIWLFLGRLGATLVPAIVTPVSLIGAVAAIWLFGFSINLITLLALVLATGLVVDDAIVVTENIQRRRAEGLGRRAASVIGTRQVFFAVIATTVTLIAVFVPISFLPSEAGRLFSEFGMVLAAAVAISSFAALSICPLIASMVPSLGNTGGVMGWIGTRLANGYQALLAPLLAAPLVAVAGATILAGAAALIYDELGNEVVPQEDRGEIQIYMQGPDGTGLDYTDRQVEQVEALFQPWIDQGLVDNLYSITGRWDLNRGWVGVRLIPWDERDVSALEIIEELRPTYHHLPGYTGGMNGGRSLSLRRGSDGQLAIALTGADYARIAEAAYPLTDALAEVEGLSRVRIQYQATQPQVSIRIDRARAADLGVPMQVLSQTLRALVDEREVAELSIGDEAVPIILQSATGAVRDPTDLLNLFVRSDSDTLVPLSQLVSFSESGVAAELDRHGQRRAIEITANVSPELTLSGALDVVQELTRDSLPPDVGLMLLGEAAALDEASNDMAFTFLVALVIVFLVLVAQFESITSAVVIMVTVPYGVCAAIFAMWITGTTVNIYSQIGVLMLIGIMAKNGILLIEFADQLRDRGYAVIDAAAEAARQRLRPIAMTLASTVLAGLPLILAEGPGAEARTAIGWVVFGGLGLAAAFTLFLTPAVYALIAGISRRRAEAGEALEREIAAATAQREPGE
ncbi:MAG: efflux RND transporter permease subunit [Pseudomonadota bacterium]